MAVYHGNVKSNVIFKGMNNIVILHQGKVIYPEDVDDYLDPDKPNIRRWKVATADREINISIRRNHPMGSELRFLNADDFGTNINSYNVMNSELKRINVRNFAAYENQYKILLNANSFGFNVYSNANFGEHVDDEGLYPNHILRFEYRYIKNSTNLSVPYFGFTVYFSNNTVVVDNGINAIITFANNIININVILNSYITPYAYADVSIKSLTSIPYWLDPVVSISNIVIIYEQFPPLSRSRPFPANKNNQSLSYLDPRLYEYLWPIQNNMPNNHDIFDFSHLTLPSAMMHILANSNTSYNLTNIPIGIDLNLNSLTMRYKNNYGRWKFKGENLNTDPYYYLTLNRTITINDFEYEDLFNLSTLGYFNKRYNVLIRCAAPITVPFPVVTFDSTLNSPQETYIDFYSNAIHMKIYSNSILYDAHVTYFPWMITKLRFYKNLFTGNVKVRFLHSFFSNTIMNISTNPYYNVEIGFNRKNMFVPLVYSTNKFIENDNYNGRVEIFLKANAVINYFDISVGDCFLSNSYFNCNTANTVLNIDVVLRPCIPFDFIFEKYPFPYINSLNISIFNNFIHMSAGNGYRNNINLNVNYNGGLASTSLRFASNSGKTNANFTVKSIHYYLFGDMLSSGNFNVNSNNVVDYDYGWNAINKAFLSNNTYYQVSSKYILNTMNFRILNSFIFLWLDINIPSNDIYDLIKDGGTYNLNLYVFDNISFNTEKSIIYIDINDFNITYDVPENYYINAVQDPMYYIEIFNANKRTYILNSIVSFRTSFVAIHASSNIYNIANRRIFAVHGTNNYPNNFIGNWAGEFRFILIRNLPRRIVNSEMNFYHNNVNSSLKFPLITRFAFMYSDGFDGNRTNNASNGNSYLYNDNVEGFIVNSTIFINTPNYEYGWNFTLNSSLLLKNVNHFYAYPDSFCGVFYSMRVVHDSLFTIHNISYRDRSTGFFTGKLPLYGYINNTWMNNNGYQKHSYLVNSTNMNDFVIFANSAVALSTVYELYLNNSDLNSVYYRTLSCLSGILNRFTNLEHSQLYFNYNGNFLSHKMNFINTNTNSSITNTYINIEVISNNVLHYIYILNNVYVNVITNINIINLNTTTSLNFVMTHSTNHDALIGSSIAYYEKLNIRVNIDINFLETETHLRQLTICNIFSLIKSEYTSNSNMTYFNIFKISANIIVKANRIYLTNVPNIQVTNKSLYNMAVVGFYDPTPNVIRYGELYNNSFLALYGFFNINIYYNLDNTVSITNFIIPDKIIKRVIENMNLTEHPYYLVQNVIQHFNFFIQLGMYDVYYIKNGSVANPSTSMFLTSNSLINTLFNTSKLVLNYKSSINIAVSVRLNGMLCRNKYNSTSQTIPFFNDHFNDNTPFAYRSLGMFAKWSESYNEMLVTNNFSTVPTSITDISYPFIHGIIDGCPITLMGYLYENGSDSSNINPINVSIYIDTGYVSAMHIFINTNIIYTNPVYVLPNGCMPVVNPNYIYPKCIRVNLVSNDVIGLPFYTITQWVNYTHQFNTSYTNPNDLSLYATPFLNIQNNNIRLIEVHSTIRNDLNLSLNNGYLENFMYFVGSFIFSYSNATLNINNPLYSPIEQSIGVFIDFVPQFSHNAQVLAIVKNFNFIAPVLVHYLNIYGNAWINLQYANLNNFGNKIFYIPSFFSAGSSSTRFVYASAVTQSANTVYSNYYTSSTGIEQYWGNFDNAPIMYLANRNII